MAGYAMGTVNDPKEKEEEGNAEGNFKQPETNTARARSERAGNLAGYTTGISKDPKEYEEEENAAGNCKQPARNPDGGSHGWGNENAPTLAPSTMAIHEGAAGRFNK